MNEKNLSLTEKSSPRRAWGISAGAGGVPSLPERFSFSLHLRRHAPCTKKNL